MTIITYISSIIIPLMILIIVICGVKEKKDVFELFKDGAFEGAKITINLLPTFIAIFLAIGLLRASGVIDLLVKFTIPITKYIGIPSEIMPLAIIRPISGSGAIGVATNIMSTYGVDSFIGSVASVIMGSTETTLYIIAVYTGGLKTNKGKEVLISALIADCVGIICSVIFCRFMS